MSSTRFNARPDISLRGIQHPFEDDGVVADILTGITNATVNCLFVLKGSCIHKGPYMSPRIKPIGFKSDDRGGHAVGHPLPGHTSWSVFSRIWSTERVKFAGAPSSISYFSSLDGTLQLPSKIYRKSVTVQYTVKR
jgi:hypothetical protein